jgi:hypothetical protein
MAFVNASADIPNAMTAKPIRPSGVSSGVSRRSKPISASHAMTEEL